MTKKNPTTIPKMKNLLEIRNTKIIKLYNDCDYDNFKHFIRKYVLPGIHPGTDPSAGPKITGNSPGSMEIDTGTVVRSDPGCLDFASTSKRIIPSALSRLKQTRRKHVVSLNFYHYNRWTSFDSSSSLTNGPHSRDWL